MSETVVMKTRLERKAENVAKDKKVVDRIDRSVAAIRAGNTVDAFNALVEMRPKANKRRSR